MIGSGLKKLGWRRQLVACCVVVCCGLAGSVVGCSSPPVPTPVEGVTLSEDGLFRGLDLEGVSEEKAYDTMLQLVKVHMGGGSLFPDPQRRSVDVRRSFGRRTAQVRLLGQVATVDGGSRVELFTRLEELRDDISDDPENPWVAGDPDRDLALEDFFFRALREELVLGPELEEYLDGPNVPANADDEGSAGESGGV